MELVDHIHRILTIVIFGPVIGVFVSLGIESLSRGTYFGGSIILGIGIAMFFLVSSSIFPELRNK